MKHLNFSVLLVIGVSVFTQNKGEELYKAEKYKEAVEAFKQALPKTPNDYNLQLGYANSLHKQDLIEKAVEQCNIAEKLNNNDTELYFDRGVAFIFLNLHRKALQDFNKSLALNDKKPELYYFMGYSNYELSRYRALLYESYNKAIELRANYAEAIYNRGAVKAELKNLEEGVKDFELALSKDPNLVTGRINVALSKLALGQFEEAIKDFDIIIETRRANLDKAFFYRGEAHFELKNKDKACNDWVKAPILGNDVGTFNIKDFCGSKTKPRKKIDIVF